MDATTSFSAVRLVKSPFSPAVKVVPAGIVTVTAPAPAVKVAIFQQMLLGLWLLGQAPSGTMTPACTLKQSESSSTVT